MTEGGQRLQGNTNQPRLSIITVVYNAAPLFGQYMANVAPYLNADVELVMIDGGSTDGTIDLLKTHSDKIDYWRSEPDKGIYDAMNKAISHTKGQWVYFLGIDDSLRDGFPAMVNELQDARTIYYGNTIYYGKPFGKQYDDYFLTKLNLVHQAVFYPRAVFDKYRYDTKYKVYADYHLNLRLWNDTDFQFSYRPHLVAGFPEGGFSSTATDPAFAQDRDRLFKQYLSRKAYYRYLNRTLGWFKTLIRVVTNG